MKIRIKGKIFDPEELTREELSKATTEMVANKVWLNGKELDFKKSLKIRTHSHTGFAWGYNGSGPAQLALSICIELFGANAAVIIYENFKTEFITPLPDEDFEIELDLSLFIVEFKDSIKQTNITIEEHRNTTD